MPDRAPVLLLALGVAGVLAALAGQVRPLVVLPLAAVLVVAAWRHLPPPPRPDARQLGALGAVLLLVAGWLVVGWRHTAEYVVVNRDPGFLTLRALWLVTHPSSLIPVGDAAAVAAAVPAAAAGTEAFWLGDGVLHPQGNVMLPVVLAAQGWLGGERAVLAGGLVIGAVALLAVFAAARRYAGPVWALVPTTALALSLPFLTFTRAAYTEPLAVACLAGGLALAHGALTPGGRWPGSGAPGPARRAEVRRVLRGRGVLVGALVGGVAAVRIDGAVAVVGLALGCLLVGLGPAARSARAATRAGARAAVLTGAGTTALGLADVRLLSPQYVAEHAGQLTALLSATALVVLVVVALLLVPDARIAPLLARVRRRRRALAGGAAGAVLLLGGVLATRPAWWQGHHTDPASGYGAAVQVLQAAAGHPLDGSRSYDEQTLAWVAWYLGLPAVVLGFAGLAVLAHRAVARRDAAATVLVAVVGVAAVFPLVRVSITPDQIWAVRRLLPATFPGLLVAGAVALAALSRPGPRAGLRRAAAAALALAVVAFPVTTWRPGASVVELSGRATQAHAVCDTLRDLGVERVVWTHSSPFRYLATLRVVCDVEVVELVEPPTPADLAAVREAWGGEPVAALTFDVDDYAWTTPPTASVGGTASTTLGRTLVGVPRTVGTTWSEVWVGLVGPDGTVTPAG